MTVLDCPSMVVALRSALLCWDMMSATLPEVRRNSQCFCLLSYMLVFVTHFRNMVILSCMETLSHSFLALSEASMACCTISPVA